VTEDTQQTIAEDLGVSRRLVGYAIEELEDSDVNLGKRSELNTDEKREQAVKPLR